MFCLRFRCIWLPVLYKMPLEVNPFVEMGDTIVPFVISNPSGVMRESLSKKPPFVPMMQFV